MISENLKSTKTNNRLGVGLIGLGHWGFKWLRIFDECGARVKACCDIDSNILKKVVDGDPSIAVFNSYQDLLKTEGIDAVYIATPPVTHYKIAKECLYSEKHVFVEKPITTSYMQGIDLVKASEETNRLIMVGDTYIYNEAIRKAKKILADGEIGKLRYIQSWMTNSVDMWAGKQIGNYSDVLWDLGPHQISIARYLTGTEPLTVSAVCPYLLQDEITHKLNDATIINLRFPHDVLVTISLNWFDHSRNRRVFISGDEGIINIDDISSKDSTKITVSKIGYKNKEIVFQNQGYDISTNNTLTNECAHFISCIRNNFIPITNGEKGVSTVRVLEAAQNSVSNKGMEKKIVD
ncbi:MAG: Gfo/Idh/MocA family oxidoreductase [Candidatus Bathyarchaeota archaeon]|nr:Gfo/Idh/MocA family oxidoreductase [Candidatus Bathyarchaeota archaeon]